MFWIPAGFAHGFVALEDNTIFAYKTTDYYNKESEGAIRWNDPDIGVEWGIGEPVISEKDKVAPFFKEFVSPFIYGEY
jgi:dTDP-4-dehydrorhamnose 3,5-epimerase